MEEPIARQSSGGIQWFNKKTQRVVHQSNGREPANRDIRANPETGPWDRQGSMPGVTGLKYRVDRLET